MTLLRSAALAALLLVSLPSLASAHHDVVNGGCAAGQVFNAGDITVTGAFTRATPASAQSAGGYFTISNSGASADTLTGASSEAATDISLHRMQMTGDVMTMSAVDGGLEIPPGGTVVLAPSGYHLMLTGMMQMFRECECVNLTLHFARAGVVSVQLNVGSMAQKTRPTGDADPSMEMDMSGMSSMEGM